MHTHTETQSAGQVLYMALEWSNRKWKLGFSDGTKWRQRTITAGDQVAILAEIAGAKAKFGLGEDVPVRSCYEAGRDGFWLHRWLRSVGIANEVGDSASIEVKFQGTLQGNLGYDKDYLTREWGTLHGYSG